MHVVHVETGRHLYGGAQQVLYLVRGLESRGVTNTIVCPPGSDLAAAALAEGLVVCELPCHGDFDIVFAHRLSDLLDRLMPTLVHAHSRRGADVFSARAAGRVPAVVSRRVDSVDPRLVAQFRYRRYRKIIAISDNVAASLRASGVDEHRIGIIRGAVDVSALSLRVPRDQWLDEFDLDEGNATIAMVSQFIERKGHDTAIEVLDRLRQTHPQVRLLLFGKGPLERSVRERVAATGLQEFVRFAGFRADLDALLGHADILLHPATREGLGVAMLKAAGAAVPVVAFNVAGAAEAVRDAETGILVSSGDVSALLLALTQLIERPAARQQLGVAGLERMCKEFSVDEMINQHIRLYESLLHDE